MRIDKWLWHARFFKTRSLAAKIVTGGHLRVDGTKIAKASYAVAPGDVLTFPQGRVIRVVRIVALSERRGPAPEAQALYEDQTPAETLHWEPVPPAPKFEGKGRPTKKDRRNSLLSRGTELE
ncbi:RNA-binding S4 domain-containing protein [Pseudoruegeria sp. SHC-113]|nr:RNA-binding S4 domain-containing protein [Pseudoruegeria sp. SHC-113]